MASQPAEEEPTVVAPQPSDQARTGETLPPADHEQTVVEPQAPEEEEDTLVTPVPGRGTQVGAVPVASTETVHETAVLEAEQPVEDPAEARRRRREERDRMLGTRRPVLDPEPDTTVDEPRLKPTTDKFFGAFGLFLLRVVAAAIIGLHGFAKAMDIEAVQQMLANTVIPEPVIVSYVLTGAEVGIALALLFGVLTRLAGAGLAAIGIGALVFVHWVGNPFVGNALTGELELLLGAVGVLFLLLGAGGWSVDAAFRRRRAAEMS